MLLNRIVSWICLEASELFPNQVYLTVCALKCVSPAVCPYSCVPVRGYVFNRASLIASPYTNRVPAVVSPWLRVPDCVFRSVCP